MTGKQRALIFVVAGLCAVFGIGGFAFVMWRMAKSVTSPAAPVEADRRLVVSADKIMPDGLGPNYRDAEVFRAMRNIDGSRNIEYSYSSAQDSGADSPLNASSSIFVFPHSLSAIQTFKMQQIAIKAALNLQKVQVVEAPQLLTLGDQHYAAILQRDGESYGNLFMFRQGRVVHTCTIAGIYYDDPELSHELLRPIIEETKRQFR